MIEYLIELDHQLLLWVNQQTGVPILDSIMIFFSEKLVWIPLYAMLLYLVFTRLGAKNTVWVMVGSACLIVLTDLGSVELFKENFQRLRPCHNSVLSPMLYLPSGRCGGQFGFVSSHASNVFGISIFLITVMASRKKRKLHLLLLTWATLVSFSRVYLAVHYPADIVFGALYGGLLGLGLGTITKRQLI